MSTKKNPFEKKFFFRYNYFTHAISYMMSEDVRLNLLWILLVVETKINSLSSHILCQMSDRDSFVVKHEKKAFRKVGDVRTVIVNEKGIWKTVIPHPVSLVDFFFSSSCCEYLPSYTEVLTNVTFGSVIKTSDEGKLI